MEEQVISIEELIESLKKRWKLIVAITVVATLISGIVSFFILKPEYEASTKVFIGKEEAAVEGYNQNDVNMYQKLMKTYAETIKTKDLVGRAIGNVSTDLTAGQVLSGLTVVPVADTQILQIKFKGGNPSEVASIVTSVGNEFIETSKQLVPNGNIQIIESVTTPKNPVSPNKKMNIAIAFLLGLMVSVG
ncbi:YveK family protein, partial [Clostridium sp.]|uniref:YveK family protein n=1 Tax=Clostridium sp. TaxID=1506 RepID=UPI003F3233CF